jgi:hypothetical protein
VICLTNDDPKTEIVRKESDVSRDKDELVKKNQDLDNFTHKVELYLREFNDDLLKNKDNFSLLNGEIKNESNEILVKVKDETKDFESKIIKYYDRVDLFIFFSILSIIVYYIISIYLLNISVPLNYLYLFSGIFLIISWRVGTHFLRERIFYLKTNIDDTLETKISNINTKLQEAKLFSVDTSTLLNNAKLLLSKNKAIIDAMRLLFPKFDALFETKSRYYKQEGFLNELETAVKQYGLNRNNNLIQELRKIRLIDNSENEFIKFSSMTLESKVGVDHRFVELSYHDLKEQKPQLIVLWEEIKKHQDLVHLLLQSILTTLNKDDRSFNVDSVNYGALEKLIVEKEYFTRDLFFEIYNSFYGRLLEDKRYLIKGLSKYGFLNDELQEIILEYPPLSVIKENYEQELFDLVANELRVPHYLVKLSYFDQKRNVQRTSEIWEEILTKTEYLTSFSKMLVQIGIFSSSFDATINSTKYVKLLVEYLKSYQNFSIEFAIEDIAKQIELIERIKGEIRKLVDRHGIGLIDEASISEFKDYVPTNKYEEDLCKKIASKIKVPYEFILLLYYDYTGSNETSSLFESIKEKEKIKQLSDFLINLGLIKISNESNIKRLSEMLNSLLIVEDKFSLEVIKDSFYEYFQIFDYSIRILASLEEENIVEKPILLFGEVVQRLRGYASTESLYNKIFDILKFKLQSSYLVKNQEDKLIKSLTISLAVIFSTLLALSEIRIKSYEEAMIDDVALKIIYKYVEIRGEEQFITLSNKTKLSTIANNVFKGFYDSYDELSLLRQSLGLKVFPNRIGELRVERMRYMMENLAASNQLKINKLESKIRIMEEQGEKVQKFFRTKLTTTIVRKSLNMELFSAYLVTSKGSGSILTEVIDKYLPGSFLALEKEYKYEKSKSLLMMAAGAAAGNSTRIGLIPIGMEFEKYGDLFNRAYVHAVRRKLSGMSPRNRTPPINELDITVQGEEKYHANLTKIIPSDDAFRRIGRENEMSEDHPLMVIQKLMDKYGAFQRFGIIASMGYDDKDESESLIKVISEFIDVASGLDELTDKKISSGIKNINVKKALENQEFDKHFKEILKIESISSYSKELYRKHSSIRDSDKESLSIEFYDLIKKVTNSLKARPKIGELKYLSDNLFKGHVDTGEVLDSLRI